VVSFSQKVSIDDALIVAKNVITERILPLTNYNTDYKIREKLSHKYQNEEVFYIFNLEPTGFVIIAADKNVDPLLAFSYETEYNKNTLHPAANMFIEFYSQQISSSLSNKTSTFEKAQSQWNHFLKSPVEFKKNNEITSIAPLLKTKWDQGTYYNNHCPEDPQGTRGHAVTGCVATALGQLLNYFRYPNRGTGSYGYQHPNYGWLEVDFSEQTYDYDKMPIAPTDENDEIAKLIYNLGVSVDMEYGPKSSGMTNHKAAYILHTYFGYNPETKYLFKDSLPNDFDWNGTLIDHLNRKIPLYYAGWADYDYISGHAFIFDGYSDSTHYHINWGWGGALDGYFLIDKLTPGGNNFTLLHEVIVNAYPNSQINSCEELKTLNFHEGIIDDGSGPLNNYKSGLECSWLISPQDSVKSINIEFLHFDVSELDYVIIYDGNSDNSPVLQQIYGNEIPSKITSSANEVLIKFVTNSTDNNNDGWLISYKSNFHEFCRNYTILNATSGVISDGSEDFSYRNKTGCRWRITHDNMENIKITFLEYDLEHKDRIRILDEKNYIKYSFTDTTINDPIIIEGSMITIEFNSDYTVRRDGFKLFYETNVENNVKINDLGNISLYPNPAKNMITINTQDIFGSSNIKIFDNNGKLCYENEHNLANNSKIELDISNYSAGIYYAVVINNGITKSLKFSKE
jgi:hypothetical protein